MKTKIPITAAVVLLSAALTVCHAEIAAAKRPNIVLFLVDDMGLMDTSVPFMTDEAGNAKRYPLNDFYRTPAMERLAGQGIRFSQFYAMSVCSPSRISSNPMEPTTNSSTSRTIRSSKSTSQPRNPPACVS